MKRVLTILAILLLPLSVWAMTPVTDSDLSNVTGQAGVNINADLTMNITIGTMAWGDANGISGVVNPWTTVSSGGYIGINNFAINNLRIRARAESADAYNSYKTVFLKPITIDVATAGKTVLNATGSGGTTQANTTFVRFGLGALKITMDQLQFDVALGTHPANPATTTIDLNQKMGVVTLGGMEMYINPWSYVDIYSHAGMGVNFDVNVTLDAFKLPYMSWGDTDGFTSNVVVPNNSTAGQYWMENGANMTAGYIGLNNFVMGDATIPAITVNGVVQIDVATTAHGIYADLQFLQELLSAGGCPVTGGEAAVLAWMHAHSLDLLPASYTLSQIYTGAGYAAYYAAITPKTVVHISFPTNFNVTMAKMTADVALSNKAGLGNAAAPVTPGTAYTQVLGDIYIQGMTMSIGAGSWVDIWAH